MTKKRLKSGLLRTSLFITVCALVGGAVSCSSSNSSSSPETLGLIPVEIAAPDFTLPTTTGTEISLSELQGTPVVLNFWAIQCPPCRMELPYFDVVAKQYSDRVTIVAIDIQDSLPQIKKFFGDSEVSFTVALDKNAQVFSSYAIQNAIPSTFFIDSQSVIRYIRLGAFTNKMELQASIGELLSKGG